MSKRSGIGNILMAFFLLLPVIVSSQSRTLFHDEFQNEPMEPRGSSVS